MSEICWICKFKIDPREYEDTVYTKDGVVHGYCLELYPMEVQDTDGDHLRVSE